MTTTKKFVLLNPELSNRILNILADLPSATAGEAYSILKNTPAVDINFSNEESTIEGEKAE